ncbi:methylated-DNA--[protein]-cysteine S-methyltransferase [Streptomyces sp. SL13]|uniref:Methylated-DNA--protein-cysteine methyltransferase n=1 Tax=Streptantibioticus silvisoli TaxID=2705255 RepID=A0AA90H6F3_9ACTN|nr:methylated-DNA--[protein]-cysteine S-methyltransferase [Streptantibioticus silvisoli]MDI5972786.1 methylated-DNA--[protein]-cysteine S-methyltransferase [Streptantibioticus silvisoli]
MRNHTVVDSPVGPLTLVATDGVLSGLYMEQHRHRPDESTFGSPDTAPFGAVIEQLRAYFAGELTDFDLPLAPAGTPFQRRVWDALREIPFGDTLTYGQLARHIGQPTASRAVGLANGRNPVSIVVPCHRVVGSDGNMTGYGGGVERKRFLLDLEQGRSGDALFPLNGNAAAGALF